MMTASHLWKYAPSDFAKCEGTDREECKSCKRKSLQIHPQAPYQTWIGPWIGHGPCPERVPDEKVS